MPSLKRILLALALTASIPALAAGPALASTSQVSIFEDDAQLHANLNGTLETMHELGATMVKVAVRWSAIAPDATSTKAPKFNATDPGAYPAANWAFLDSVVTAARSHGLQVGFMLTEPVPRWAEGAGLPRGDVAGNWKPSASAFGAFVRAVGERYDGSYKPAGAISALPRVSWWSIWNEPNYGPDLAPQATNNNKVPTGPIMYRGLLDAAWSGLAATGHKPSKDTILLGETAPRGVVGDGQPGSFGGTVPILFLDALYCTNSSAHRLTGAAAKADGCPSSAAAFRSQNPALFGASGYADHPYAQGTPPNIPTYACKRGGANSFCSNARTKKSDPYYADLSEVGRLETTLDRLNSAYGSHTKFPIWNTEYGYWTNPPDSAASIRFEVVSPATAALYLNWAEYLSYKNSRLASFDQYLLVDTTSNPFNDGLELPSGEQLPTFAAWEMPLFLPTTTVSKPSSLTVWGAVRPASSALVPATADIQFLPAGSSTWTTAKLVPITNRRGYFDVSVPFTKSGSVRVAWTAAPGQVDYSRTQAITVK